MWFIYTMEHYSAIKNNETMSFAATGSTIGFTLTKADMVEQGGSQGEGSTVISYREQEERKWCF